VLLLLLLAYAQVVCEQLKVQSQNDTAKLAEAKQMVYLKVTAVMTLLHDMLLILMRSAAPVQVAGTLRGAANLCMHIVNS
jgi:hypothetical protein